MDWIWKSLRKNIDTLYLGVIKKKGSKVRLVLRGRAEIAEIVANNGGDTRIKIERVDGGEMFLVRIVMTIDNEGKERIKKELFEKYGECVVV